MKTDDPEMFKMKTKSNEIKDLKKNTKKHDHEKTLKSFKIDNEYYKRSIEV